MAYDTHTGELLDALRETSESLGASIGAVETTAHQIGDKLRDKAEMSDV